MSQSAEGHAEELQMALKLMQCSPWVTIATWVDLGVAQPQGLCILRTLYCYGVRTPLLI